MPAIQTRHNILITFQEIGAKDDMGLVRLKE